MILSIVVTFRDLPVASLLWHALIHKLLHIMYQDSERREKGEIGKKTIPNDYCRTVMVGTQLILTNKKL